MFTAVKEFVCIGIVSLVSLAFSSATRMAVISASCTEAESLILIFISSSLCTTAAATSTPSLEPSGIVRVVVWLRTVCSSDLCFSISVPPPEPSPSYISMVVVPMGRCRLFLVVVLVPPILFNIIQVSRTCDSKLLNYSLTGQVLEEVMDTKYLGVTLSNALEWSKHVATMTNKTNSKFSFLRRNLKGCPEKIKQTVYFSLIRSFMEYGATVWDPYKKIQQWKNWEGAA